MLFEKRFHICRFQKRDELSGELFVRRMREDHDPLLQRRIKLSRDLEIISTLFHGWSERQRKGQYAGICVTRLHELGSLRDIFAEHQLG